MNFCRKKLPSSLGHNDNPPPPPRTPDPTATTQTEGKRNISLESTLIKAI